MVVKHKRMGRAKGDEALEDLNDALRETMTLIKGEEAFDAETDASPANTQALVEKFPALEGGARMLG